MELRELEKQIGYQFQDRSLLELALTHSSFANEHGYRRDNERLEFLGDSVLGFLTAEYLFRKFETQPEGELTRRRANAVCEKTLAGFARELNLGDYIRLGKGEKLSGGANRPSILSDAFESVIAAVYLDGGVQAAKDFVLRFIPEADTGDKPMVDYKTVLQEVVQKNPDEQLHYVLAAEAGPDHDKTFTVEVYLNSNRIGTGVGHSKKKAEQAAAAEALKLMGIRI
ncbi:MAG: ribonuclease III [Clostridia bacterium]|nr:ribonuclease III [Clostridia bacterium]